jgi:hypothetical protein
VEHLRFLNFATVPAILPSGTRLITYDEIVEPLVDAIQNQTAARANFTLGCGSLEVDELPRKAESAARKCHDRFNHGVVGCE